MNPKSITHSKDDNVYKKNPDGTYSPIGLIYDRYYLTDGIWMCQHHEHSTGLTNGSYLEGLFKIADIKRTWPEISNLKYITDRVLDDKEFTDWFFSKRNTGVSMHDIVAKTVAKICDTIKRIGDEDMKK